jgi:hypothetical protein
MPQSSNIALFHRVNGSTSFSMRGPALASSAGLTQLQFKWNKPGPGRSNLLAARKGTVPSQLSHRSTSDPSLDKSVVNLRNTVPRSAAPHLFRSSASISSHVLCWTAPFSKSNCWPPCATRNLHLSRGKAPLSCNRPPALTFWSFRYHDNTSTYLVPNRTILPGDV